MSDAPHRTHDVVALMAGRYELVRELAADGDVRRWEAFDTALQRRVLLDFLPHDVIEDPVVVDRFWRSARMSARNSNGVGERVLDAGTDPETGRAFVVREWATPPPRPIVPERGRSLVSPGPPRKLTAYRGSRVLVAGAAAAVAIVLLVVRPGVEGWLAWVNEPFEQATAQFVLGPAPTAQPAVTPAVAATAAPAAKATALPATATVVRTPTAGAGVKRRIVNTDGRGVALRSSPGGQRLPGRGYDEGATVQAFESSGEWTRIQGSDGRQGWVLSVTLAP